MKLSEILQLKEAGYTAEEIQSLASVITEEPEAPAVQQIPAVNYDEKFTAMEKQISDLTELIQKQAIRSSDIKTETSAQPSLLSIASSILGGETK